jgi:hypothetical protein
LVRQFVSEVYARHRGLALVGALNLAAAGVFLLLMFVDQTTVLGINRWIKPFKFGISVGTYLWTVAWFLPYLRVGKKTSGGIGWAIAIVMFFENAMIFMQAIRGMTSHFNDDTAFDGAVFGVMGLMIFLNSILLGVLFILFIFRASDVPKPWIWAIRIGFFLLIVGSAGGGYMIGNGGHSVGTRDGGAGLPLVNWNTEAGDLRPAHLIGLHGVQVIPLFAYWLSRRRLTTRRQLALVFAFSMAYALLGIGLFWQALRGIPLLLF